MQQAFKVTPIYKEIKSWTEEEGYHMGVYLAVNFKSHEFNHTNNNVYNLEQFLKMNVEKYNTETTKIENLKTYYNSFINKEPSFIIFLSESKHKIKKKAEQAACKMAYENIIAK